MNSKTKTKIVKWSILTFLGFILFFLVGQYLISHKIESIIQKEIPDSLLLDYSNFRFSLLSRSIELKEFSLISDTLSAPEGTFFQVDTHLVQISGIAFLPLIKNNEVEIARIELDRPDIKLIPRKKESGQTPKRPDFPSSISIKELRIFDASGTGVHAKTGEILWKLPKFSIEMDQIQINDGELFRPSFDTTSLKANAELLYLKLNELDTLHVDRFSLTKNDLNVQNLRIKTKYDPETLLKKLRNERDYFDFGIGGLQVSNIQMPLQHNKRDFIADSLQISDLKCTIYRDKTLPDDNSTKKYYIEMLEELPFPLRIGHTSISSSSLSYLERTNDEIDPRPLLFTGIQGKIQHIANFGEPKIITALDAQLMDESPISLQLETQAGHPNGSFTVTGKAFNFDATKINPFLKTNMGVTSEGWVDELYFTFSGNKQEASGDMKMKYEDFEFNILQKDLLGIRKTTSFLLNLLVNSGSGADKDGFRYGEIKAEPDRTKSFMNYIWVCIRSGLLDTVTGSGEKNVEE